MESIITNDINTYITNHTDSEDILLQEISEAAKNANLNYFMASGHLQGNLLRMLSKMAKPTRALEIGTFVGYSTICIAQGMGENGLLTSVDNNKAHIEFAKKFIEKTELNIELVHCDAKFFLENLNFNPDFVFIDANKKNNLLYYNLAMEKLTNNGIILIDNILNKGLVTHEVDSRLNDSFKELNSTISKDTRVLKLILPIRDGLLLIMKK